MPSALIEVPVDSATAGPSRKRWTRAECASLEASGLLDEQHLELVEGELIDRMGKSRSHISSLTFIFAWLLEIFGKNFVNSEAPIDVSPEDNPSNEPEPDLIVFNRDFSHFRSTNPGPQDLHLVVEIADSTLRFDLTTKAALYARAGIVEYWVLDVSGRRLIVHRYPKSGKYTAVLVYGDQENVAPLAAPHAMFKAADAFPE
jgi:Uma2 family endonuclease